MDIDHLVFGGPDLVRAIDDVRSLLGVDPVTGGSHPGLGTRNALVSLGSETYLEILGPDTAQPAPAGGRPFGIDGVGEARLVGWAVRTSDLQRTLADLGTGRFGEPTEMHRTKPDGTVLSWRLTSPDTGVVPFLIDWGDTPHPTASLPSGVELRSLRIEHPEPDEVRRLIALLGVNVDVRRGPEPRLAATIDTPTSRVVLW